MKWEKQVDEHREEYAIHTEEGAQIARIYFMNKKFDRAWFEFKGTYSREQWKMLAMIEKKITQIERSKK